MKTEVKPLERPACQGMGTGMCDKPARWTVTLMKDKRGYVTCDQHRDRWAKSGYGCWIGKLVGGHPETMEDASDSDDPNVRATLNRIDSELVAGL